MRRSLIHDFEKLLRDAGIPYISVGEAKKALFANAKLKSFHFVAYSKTGANWLTWCGARRADVFADMREWEKVFGDGFKTVIVSRRGDAVRYSNLDGQAIEFAELTAPGAPTPRQPTGRWPVPPQLVVDLLSTPLGADNVHQVILDVAHELDRARAKHAPMNSAHEAYSVILEELDEFWDEVKKRTPGRENMRIELVQIAAMACRAVIDLHLADATNDLR